MHLNISVTLAVLGAALAAKGIILLEDATSKLRSIDKACVKLKTTITEWSGSLPGAVSITHQSAAVIESINEIPRLSTSGAAHGPAKMSDAELQDFFQAGDRLAQTVKGTVDAMIEAKPQVEKSPVLGRPAGINLIKGIFTATENAGALLVDNTVPKGKAEARRILSVIEDQLKRGMSEYE